MRRPPIRQADYAALAEFRYLIRRFLEFSETEAKLVGLTPRQHQALLAIKGPGAAGPVSIGDLAERLCIRHHSAVELVNRLAEKELVERITDSADHRRILLGLCPKGEASLADLSAAHLNELSRIRPMLSRVLDREGADGD
jgi:DNA-binding MarR family transcriptional regulator